MVTIILIFHHYSNVNKNIKLSMANKSNRKGKYLDEKLADKIYNFYEKDFVILKYNKDTWTNF